MMNIKGRRYRKGHEKKKPPCPQVGKERLSFSG
jgi:hypothetical protein